MLDHTVPIMWIFECERCGHELRARSARYESPCPVCNGRLVNAWSDFEESLNKEVKKDAT